MRARACVCVCPCVCVPVLWTACDGVKGGGYAHINWCVCAHIHAFKFNDEVVYWYVSAGEFHAWCVPCGGGCLPVSRQTSHKSTNRSRSVARRSLRVGRRNVVVVH